MLSTALSYLYFSQPSTNVSLSGSGATFPAPLLTAIITNYHSTNIHVQITYDAVGSSNGITALQDKTVDFACSDAPLSDTDRTKAPNALHIPETAGAVAVAYNIEGISTGLNLTGTVIADIFSGQITKWNNEAIQSLNPNLTLPANDITVVHRLDGSGTTFIFTSYLSETSPEWNNSIGSGKKVEWPVGLAATGNPGVAGVIQGNRNSIGYVELAYVIENNMTAAAIKNPAGNWVTPSLQSTQIAVESGASSGLPSGEDNWSSVSLLNAQDAQAYPIVSFTYTLVYQELNVIPDMTKDIADELVNFLWWMMHDGQNLAPELGYAELPANVIQVNEDTIKTITFNGQPLTIT
ncbi:MAG: phosphate ABC transporter substrate-binding protein PstS [Candidatus Bathyarchaeota archaeon]|nr:phosphate ABC transporter substrate-binding protein PstS [Candidatus Bathyarchaeota archaeon]